MTTESQEPKDSEPEAEVFTAPPRHGRRKRVPTPPPVPARARDARLQSGEELKPPENKP